MAAFDGTTYVKGTRVSVAGKPGTIEAVGLNGWYVVDGKSVHHSAIEPISSGASDGHTWYLHNGQCLPDCPSEGQHSGSLLK